MHSFPANLIIAALFSGPFINAQAGPSSDQQELPQVRVAGDQSLPEPPPGVESLPMNITHPGGVKALPVQQASLIFVGRVTARAAKPLPTGAQTTIQAAVENVLKDKSNGLSTQVVFTRFGGTAVFPSGRTQDYRNFGEHMPRTGKRYLFFLSGTPATGYSLLTAYNITDSQTVRPLDDPTVFSAYQTYNGAQLGAVLTKVETLEGK